MARVDCSVFTPTVLGPREAQMRILGCDSTESTASIFISRFQLSSNPFRIIERPPSIVKARSGNLNLDISSLTCQISLRHLDGNAPAGENTWNNGFLDAERQSHENYELFLVRHLGLWTQNQPAFAAGGAGSSRTEGL
jgi:hypothetical protein